MSTSGTLLSSMCGTSTLISSSDFCANHKLATLIIASNSVIIASSNCGASLDRRKTLECDVDHKSAGIGPGPRPCLAAEDLKLGLGGAFHGPRRLQLVSLGGSVSPAEALFHFCKPRSRLKHGRPSKELLLRRAGPIRVAPLPLVTKQLLASRRTARAGRSDRVARGAGWDIVPMMRLGHSSGNGNRKKRHCYSLHHVQPPY